jgi:hypothetical protein
VFDDVTVKSAVVSSPSLDTSETSSSRSMSSVAEIVPDASPA